MKLVTQEQLNQWLDTLAHDAALIAPVQVQGKLFYRPVSASAEIAWGYERTDMSPKTWLFPATEPILNIEQGKETRLHAPAAPGKKVVFGVRPCDARGALAIDALFLDTDPADGQYARHREATTLIGLACPQQWETCFCTVVGGAPNGTDGLDVLLTEVKGGFAVKVITDKGAAATASLAGQEAEVALPAPQLRDDLPALRPSDKWEALFKDVYWQRLSERCLSCRTCPFVCPTCRCFDVRDTHRPGEDIQRIRAWDGCLSEGYRRIAGGHNPRPTKAERLRNRFFCKFNYYPQMTGPAPDLGPVACVGCGRCIDKCPVNVDLVEVLHDVASLQASTVLEVV